MGGLGFKDGRAATYIWTSSISLGVIPWLGLLGLFFLKSNRRGAAWLIWIPVLCCFGLESGLMLIPGIDSRSFNMFQLLVDALVFGMAATWLLSGYLARMHRILTFLASGMVMAGYAGLAFTRGGADISADFAGLLVATGCSVVIICLALHIAFWLCRRRYSWMKLLLWTFVGVFGFCLLALSIVLGFQFIVSRGNIELMQFMLPVLVGTVLLFGVTLPFLLLSFLSGLYRDRLKALLRLPAMLPPPIIMPPVIPSPFLAADSGLKG